MLSIDVEAFEHDKSFILEVGVTYILHNRLGLTNHYVVRENLNKRNGRFCPDCRDDFHHGTSEVYPLHRIKRIVRKRINDADALLFHSVDGDRQFLRNIGITIDHKPIVDTQRIARAHFGKNQQSLGSLYEHYVGGDFLAHNAGNDSRATAEVYLQQLKRGIVPKDFLNAG